MDTNTSEQSDYQSRKERRLAERQEQKRSVGGQRFTRRIMVWGITLLVLGGIGWGIVELSKSVPLPTDDGTLAVPVSATDNSSGPADAPITLVEYGDFQCPACGTFHPLIVKLLAEPDLKDKVRFVYRNYPLRQLHPNAQIAAQAGQAAALQNKFWPMHDKIYETQNTWSGKSNTGAKEAFIGYATDLGLDIEKFKQDIESSEVKAKITADIASGDQSVVSGTPTFYVNSKRMQTPQSYEQFKQFVMAPLSAPIQ